MFEIKDVAFRADSYGSDSYLYNWPMVYILENGKQAYVGQTTNLMKRMAQHKESEKKKIFQRAHFIYSDRFNQSAALDYESRLISLMAADGKFVLTNQNVGLTGLNYYDKIFYDEEFALLWRKLQEKNLVEKSITELQQSDLFKYSPYKELNTEQRTLVNELISNLKRSLGRKILVSGMPGSGKTILAIYLFKMLREIPDFKEKKIGMIVPPTSLRDTYKKVFRQINGLSAKDVFGPTDVVKEKYDILLVDEAHRLKKRKNLSSYSTYDRACEALGMDKTVTQLDWILKQTSCAIFFYDRNQLVFPAGLPIDQMITQDPFDSRMISCYTLWTQMRCQGGIPYLRDLQDLLHGSLKDKVTAADYELKIADSFEQFETLYRKKETEHGLTRMIAGYAWKWKSKNNPENVYDIEIEGYQKKWNSCLSNWVHSENAVNEVGCIHSTQGYDLNYGFVIIGEDLKYDPGTKQIYVEEQNYFDKYGKLGTEKEELENYVKNIYYVLMTRGIKGTYLYVCDPELRRYLKQYIEAVDE